MAELDDLLATDAPAESLDDLLAVKDGPTRSTFHVPTDAEMKQFNEWNKPREQLWYQRAAQGVNDPLIGAGQLMQNVLPDAVLNAGRKVTDPIVNTVLGGDPVDSSSTSTKDFNEMVRRREHGYQAERAEAGQDGMDWTRIGGNVANPMTWLGPKGAGAGLWTAIKTGAKQGAFQALMQPATSAGSFIWDKAMQTSIGAAAGGTLGAALEILRPAFSHGAAIIRKAVGGTDDATKAAAADRITNETIETAGVDPKKMDPSLYSAIRQEVGDALKAGVDPDPKVMTNRADAAALPVPIDLTRGQAARDAMQFSWEINNSKLREAGAPLAERLTQQNRQLIENLNELGARNAPSTFDASQTLIQHIEGIDAAAKSKIDEAYQAVRDSAGRPALMNHVTFVEQANKALDTGQLGPYLPEAVRSQLNDIAAGKLPLTVNVAQQLDRVWGAAQRGTQDGSTKMAIGQLRTALNDAPVTDALGQESMAAYQAARSLAKQRFDMIDANPAYKAVTEGVEPDKFFQKYVQGANVSELTGLKSLVGADNTSMLQQTLLGNLKKVALNRVSDENGVFSQSAFNRVLQDPVQGRRLQELFKDNPQVLGQLYRLGRVAENVQAFPKGHSVNTSNTAPTAANMLTDIAKSEAASSLWNMVPGGRAIRHVTEQANQRTAASKAVNEALNPGVTRTPLRPPAPSPKVKRLSDLAARAGATYAASEADE